MASGVRVDWSSAFLEAEEEEDVDEVAFPMEDWGDGHGWSSHDDVSSLPLSARDKEMHSVSRSNSRKQSRRGSGEMRPISRSNKNEVASVHFMPFFGSGSTTPIHTAANMEMNCVHELSPKASIQKHYSPKHSTKSGTKPRIIRRTIQEF